MADTLKNKFSIIDTPSIEDTSHITDVSTTDDTSRITDASTIDDTSHTEFHEILVYDTAMVSNILGVQDSTLRKYCALMQKHNYKFNKNSVGHRIFYKKDVEIIRKIVDLKNSSSLTLNQSVKTILESDIEDIEGNDVADIDSITKPDYNKLLQAFTAFKDDQQQFNKQLIDQLQKQQDYIKNSIDERDKKLMLAIKESMEVRRQLASAVEDKDNAKKQKNNWWQFWK